MSETNTEQDSITSFTKTILHWRRNYNIGLDRNREHDHDQ
jgi:hypothetical protein